MISSISSGCVRTRGREIPSRSAWAINCSGVSRSNSCRFIARTLAQLYAPSARANAPSRPSRLPVSFRREKEAIVKRAWSTAAALAASSLAACAPASEAKPPAAQAVCDGTDPQRCEDECRRGRQTSCIEIGAMFARGERVPKDPARAVRFFSWACEHGDLDGCARAGGAALVGFGGPKDPQLGAALLERACRGGDGFGCAILGEMYWDGDGVAADPARALSLSNLA